jgi:hypothetical protein
VVSAEGSIEWGGRQERVRAASVRLSPRDVVEAVAGFHLTFGAPELVVDRVTKAEGGVEVMSSIVVPAEIPESPVLVIQNRDFVTLGEDQRIVTIERQTPTIALATGESSNEAVRVALGNAWRRALPSTRLLMLGPLPGPPDTLPGDNETDVV